MRPHVIYDVTFWRTIRRVPGTELSAVRRARDAIIAEVPNLPALTDAVFEDVWPGLHHARYVLGTPWVVVYCWEITTQVLVLRAVRAPDPPF